MKYKAILSRMEVEKFISDFCKINPSDGTSVIIDLKDFNTSRKFYVTIENLKHKDLRGPLLKASFKDGLLSRRRWNKKFQIEKELERANK